MLILERVATWIFNKNVLSFRFPDMDQDKHNGGEIRCAEQGSVLLRFTTAVYFLRCFWSKANLYCYCTKTLNMFAMDCISCGL
jgi:hypothetical protein